MSAATTSQRLAAAHAFVRQNSQLQPRIGIVLGSGLSGFATELSAAQAWSYADIPHLPRSSVAGHPGQLMLGQLGDNIPCAVLVGRVHYYEGHSLAETAMAVRLLAALGVQKLLVTNAAGGLQRYQRPGDLMVICDQLNLTGDNPLRGPADGGRSPFCDMSAAYCPQARQLWQQSAAHLGLQLHSGIYAGLSGPCYETPAEISMLQRLGADVVGMSTVGEVIVARSLGLQVAGLSLISNAAAGLSPTPLSHQEVTAMGAQAAPRVRALVRHFVGLWDALAAPPLPLAEPHATA